MIAGVPYDAEVAYLESTGTQWIDTDFKANTTTTRLDIGLSITAMMNNSALFGSRNTANVGDTKACNAFCLSNGMFRWDWAIGGTSATSNVTLGNKYEVSITRGKLTINGSTATFPNTDSINQNYNFLLFNLSNGSATPYSAGMVGRIYYAKLYSNNTLVRDLIPVRVGSGANAVGYMYDRVSKRLFGNQGTGNFVIGEDVATPVMGIWKQEPTNPYQTTDNALWMMYNGAWNNGIGFFSPNATQIIDCMGHEAPIAAGSVGDNKMWREPTSIFNITPSPLLGSMIYNRVFSMMFIGRVAQRGGGPQDVMTFYNNSDRYVSLVCNNQNKFSPVLYRGAFSGGDIIPTWDENNEVVFAWVFTFDGTTRRQRYRQIGGSPTVDYTLSPTAALLDKFTPTALSFGYATKCEIAVAAMYNREITQSEFDGFWNAAKLQFGLTQGGAA